MINEGEGQLEERERQMEVKVLVRKVTVRTRQNGGTYNGFVPMDKWMMKDG